jgi:hypothetical protein
MNKVMLMVMMILLSVGIASAYVYQETADSYSYNNTGNWFDAPTRFQDGINVNGWNSGFNTYSTSGLGCFWINYTLPSGKEVGYWQIYGTVLQNVSLWNGCKARNPVQLKVCSDANFGSGNGTYWYCYDGIDFLEVTRQGDRGLTEEAIWWQDAPTTTTTTSTTTTTVAVTTTTLAVSGVGNLGIKDVLSETGQGIGTFSEAIRMPLGKLLMFLALIGGVIALITGIIFAIKTVVTKHIK